MDTKIRDRQKRGTPRTKRRRRNKIKTETGKREARDWRRTNNKKKRKRKKKQSKKGKEEPNYSSLSSTKSL